MATPTSAQKKRTKKQQRRSIQDSPSTSEGPHYPCAILIDYSSGFSVIWYCPGHRWVQHPGNPDLLVPSWRIDQCAAAGVDEPGPEDVVGTLTSTVDVGNKTLFLSAVDMNNLDIGISISMWL